VPVSLLKDGVNTLVFSAEDESPGAGAASGASAATPLALKSVALQLNYAAAPAPPAPELPVLHLSNVVPIPLDDSGAPTTSP
jgi:hypothetical protein